MENSSSWFAVFGVLAIVIVMILLFRRGSRPPAVIAPGPGDGTGQRFTPGTGPDHRVGPDPHAPVDPASRPDANARPR